MAKRPNNPRWDKLPTPIHQRRKHGVGSLHLHHSTLEMSINRDVATRLGWKRGDQVIYKIEEHGLRVVKMEM